MDNLLMARPCDWVACGFRPDGMVEVANAGALWSALQLPREYLVFVAIAACDACPRGAPQVGAKTVLKAIKELLDSGEKEPTLDQMLATRAISSKWLEVSEDLRMELRPRLEAGVYRLRYFLGLIPTGLPAPAPAVQLQIGSLQGATAEQQARVLDMIGSYYWPQLVPDAASWPAYSEGALVKPYGGTLDMRPALQNWRQQKVARAASSLHNDLSTAIAELQSEGVDADLGAPPVLAVFQPRQVGEDTLLVCEPQLASDVVMMHVNPPLLAGTLMPLLRLPAASRWVDIFMDGARASTDQPLIQLSVRRLGSSQCIVAQLGFGLLLRQVARAAAGHVPEGGVLEVALRSAPSDDDPAASAAVQQQQQQAATVLLSVHPAGAGGAAVHISSAQVVAQRPVVLASLEQSIWRQDAVTKYSAALPDLLRGPRKSWTKYNGRHETLMPDAVGAALGLAASLCSEGRQPVDVLVGGEQVAGLVLHSLPLAGRTFWHASGCGSSQAEVMAGGLPAVAQALALAADAPPPPDGALPHRLQLQLLARAAGHTAWEARLMSGGGSPLSAGATAAQVIAQLPGNRTEGWSVDGDTVHYSLPALVMRLAKRLPIALPDAEARVLALQDARLIELWLSGGQHVCSAVLSSQADTSATMFWGGDGTQSIAVAAQKAAAAAGVPRRSVSMELRRGESPQDGVQRVVVGAVAGLRRLCLEKVWTAPRRAQITWVPEALEGGSSGATAHSIISRLPTLRGITALPAMHLCIAERWKPALMPADAKHVGLLFDNVAASHQPIKLAVSPIRDRGSYLLESPELRRALPAVRAGTAHQRPKHVRLCRAEPAPDGLPLVRLQLLGEGLTPLPPVDIGWVQSFARPFQLQDDGTVTCSLAKLVDSYKLTFNKPVRPVLGVEHQHYSGDLHVHGDEAAGSFAFVLKAQKRDKAMYLEKLQRVAYALRYFVADEQSAAALPALAMAEVSATAAAASTAAAAALLDVTVRLRLYTAPAGTPTAVMRQRTEKADRVFETGTVRWSISVEVGGEVVPLRFADIQQRLTSLPASDEEELNEQQDRATGQRKNKAASAGGSGAGATRKEKQKAGASSAGAGPSTPGEPAASGASGGAASGSGAKRKPTKWNGTNAGKGSGLAARGPNVAGGIAKRGRPGSSAAAKAAAQAALLPKENS